MPWNPLAQKIRKNPLGPGTMNALVDQLAYVKSMAAAEHIISSGEHNAWPVPRVVRRVSGTSVTPSSSDITSVTNPSTGRYVVNLAASRFNADMRVQINGGGDGTKPYLWSWKKVSATQLEVFCQKLSTALGAAGNAWAAASADFDLAIHSVPLAAGAWSLAHPSYWTRGANLDDGTATWNGLVRAMNDVQLVLAAEHTTAGEHNVVQVGKAAAKVVWDSGGTKYDFKGSYPGMTSLSRTSTGIAVVTHDSYTTPCMAFICPDYDRFSSGAGTSQFIINAVQTSATQTTVYGYAWDGSKWNRADGDFFIVIHGS